MLTSRILTDLKALKQQAEIEYLRMKTIALETYREMEQRKREAVMSGVPCCVQNPDLKPRMIVKHYKGKLYKIVCGWCRDTETFEWLVIYHPINSPNQVFARPRREFYDLCYINGLMKQRFVAYDLLAKHELDE